MTLTPDKHTPLGRPPTSCTRAHSYIREMLRHALNARLPSSGDAPLLPAPGLPETCEVTARQAAALRRPCVLAPGACPPSGSGAAASWAPGLARLAGGGGGLWGGTGRPWAAGRAHCCHSSQGQATRRLVQVSGVSGAHTGLTSSQDPCRSPCNIMGGGAGPPGVRRHACSYPATSRPLARSGHPRGCPGLAPSPVELAAAQQQGEGRSVQQQLQHLHD